MWRGSSGYGGPADDGGDSESSLMGSQIDLRAANRVCENVLLAVAANDSRAMGDDDDGRAGGNEDDDSDDDADDGSRWHDQRACIDCRSPLRVQRPVNGALAPSYVPPRASQHAPHRVPFAKPASRLEQ